MPRDSTETKARLLREAERLFARRGAWQVTVREITQAAGQRNVSALNYHFGSREGVLDAILTRHGDPTDEARGEHLAAVGRDAPSRDLMAALVVPYASHLGTPEGRDYLRIVAQLTGQFSTWRDANPGVGPWLIEILGILEGRPDDVPAPLRRERVVESIMLMTAALSERARAIESARDLELDEPTFVANLTDVLVGILEAPVRGPLPVLRTR
ncbi:MAG: putative TetR family transcriptional regulator [Actinomycetia bacterium]|nr:putative TetR family transcriptional regulator [Actinomycetes bacterium]